MTMHYIAADYVAALLEHAAQQGMAVSALWASGSMPTVLTGLVPWPVMAALVQSCVGENDEVTAGLQFGLTLDISRHGLLGYAAKSARTPLEALLLDEKYLATRTSVIHFRVLVQQDRVRVHLESLLKADAPGWRFLHMAVLGSLARMYRDLFHRQVLDAVFTVPFPVNAAERCRDPLLAGIRWEEEPGGVRLATSLSLLLAVLPSGDETLKQLLVDQCEAGMPALTVGEDRVGAVRSLLRHQLVDPPSVGQLALQLNLSERTLKRHLQQGGVSYRGILMELRVEAATHYLRSTDWPVERIASRLGYESPATFRNLFRRWTGKTPGEVRNSCETPASSTSLPQASGGVQAAAGGGV